MKMNCYDRKRWIYRVICSLTAVALAVGFIVTHPTLSRAAEYVDLDKKCALTVKPSSSEDEEFIKDLEEANVVIDLYKVAAAEKVEGYDSYTYTYEAVSPYSSLDFNNVASNEEWMELAQAAAAVVFPKNSEEKNDTPVKEGQPVNASIDSLDAGLYLVIARGRDMTEVKDYVSYVAAEAVDGETEGMESIVTLANSDVYTYKFFPELISLPYRGDPDRDGEGAGTSAQYGEWTYDLTITLKPGREARYVPLEIVKILPAYETSNEAATFVFQIEASIGNPGDSNYWKYSNVESISFTASDGIEKKVQLADKIRAGATVKVTEVYSGVTYELSSGYGIEAGGPDGDVRYDAVGDTVTFQVVQSGREYSVFFTNDYDGTGKQGGAITNWFEYSEENGWQWTQIPDVGGTGGTSQDTPGETE